MAADLSGVKLEFVDSVDKASELMRWLGERRPEETLGVDLETGELPGRPKQDALSPWHGKIRLSQIGDSMTGWAIPWERWGGVFQEAFNKFEGRFLIHNSAFDVRWLMLQSEVEIPWHRLDDSMIGSRIVSPTESAALKRLTAKYVDPRAAALQTLLDDKMRDNGWTWGTVPINLQEYWCVPETTEILTRRGWVKHNEILEDDETLGFDVTTQTSVWTKIKKVTRIQNAPVVRVGTKHWSTVCTDQHNWLYQRPKSAGRKFNGYGDVRIAPLSELQIKRNAKLFLAAPDVPGGDSPLTAGDAAVLAWLLADGHVHWKPENKYPIAHIFQSVGDTADEVRLLLKEEGAYKSESIRVGNETTRDNIKFYLRSRYVTDLYNKAEFWSKPLNEVVLSLSKEARAAWWTAWKKAEGTKDSSTGGYKVITQNLGPKFDAIALTAYLEGVQVRVQKQGKKGCARIPLGNRSTTFQKSQPVNAGTADVWCPTTETGSWTARDAEGNIFLTGNCYGALDTVLSVRMWEKLGKDLLPGGKYADVYDLEMGARRVCTMAEINGARIDVDYAEQKHGELLAASEAIKDWAKRAYKTNIGSTKQLAHTFEHTLGANIEEYTPGGSPKMDKVQLQKFIRDHKGTAVSELAEQVLASRKAEKLATSYFRNFLDRHVDGILHPSINTLAARTGRMSIQDPALQTLPKRDKVVRKGFIPRTEDEIIMSCDLEQVEARVFSCLSGDTGLIDLFNYCDTSGEDFFTQIGREVYSEPTMTKEDWRRQLIKGLMYGRLYGAGISKMALTAGVADSQMKVVNDSFDARFPGMKNLMRHIEDIGMRRFRDEGEGYVLTGSGRRLPCDEGKAYTLVNYLIQGTSAEILKLNLLKCDAAGLTPYLIVPVHDELVLSVPRADQIEVGKVLQECMTTREGWTVPLLAGAATVGERWGELD